MSSSDSLKAFLKEQKKRDAGANRLSFKEEKAKLRKEAIRGLFDEIEGWLRPSKDEGIVAIERGPFSHTDTQLGVTLDEEMVGDMTLYLKEENKVQVTFHDSKALSVELPATTSTRLAFKAGYSSPRSIVRAEPSNRSP